LKDPDVDEADRKNLQELYDSIVGASSMPTDFLSHRYMLRKYFNRMLLSADEIINIIRFFGREPVTGLNTVNKFLGIFSFLGVKPIDPSHRWLQHGTKLFLSRQLRIMLNQLRKEDAILSFEDISQIPDAILQKICFDRAIDLDKSRRE